MKGPLARSTLRTTAVLVLRLLTQTGTLLAITRLLGPAGYGHFAGLAGLAVGLGTLATFGSHLVLLAESSRDPARMGDVLGYAVPLTVLTGSGLFAIYLAIAGYSGLMSVGWPVVMMLGIAELWMMPLLTLPAMAIQAREHAATSVLLLWTPLALRLLAAVLCIAIASLRDLDVYVALYLAASIAGLTVGSWIVRRHLLIPIRWRLPRHREWTAGTSYALMNFTSLNPTEIDKTLALRLIGPVETGIYAAATRVIGAAVTPIIGMLVATQPRLFRHAHSDRSSAVSLVRALGVSTLIYGLCVGVALALVAPWLAALFGPRFTILGTTLRTIAVLAPLLGLRFATGNTLMSLGKPLARAGFEFVGILVLVAGMIVLAPSYGLNGAIAAVCSAEASMVLLGAVLILHTLNAGRRECR